ncbi:MAG: radical SAM family heme chaperone HemW [Bacteroidales bacterium]
MAGLYIHVPFCRQACRYCDFYFTVSLKYRDEFVNALLKEISYRKNYIFRDTISTIYLGGGTPSVLSKKQLDRIMGRVIRDYSIDGDAEITIEANPDDLTGESIDFLRGEGFNRLSIGIQSFQEKNLELMRRSHNAKQAKECIGLAQSKGFENISIDLIYGLPGLSLSEWEETVGIAMEQPITHISAYHLTYEPGTVFHHWKKKGRLNEVPEQISIDQYYSLRKLTGEAGFEHYEISNFALEGFRSKHNSTYWTGKKYLGLGPSAHSFNGKERCWNVSSLKQYIEKVNSGEKFTESEILTTKDSYHDYLLTSLRTSDGADTEYIHNHFGEKILTHLIGSAKPFIESEDIILEKGILRMTPGGWLRSDQVIEALMLY